jgi:hypothetical protein
LPVPEHGSPKVELLAVMVQLDRPTHCPDTTFTDDVALQLLVAKLPQLPVGVP